MAHLENDDSGKQAKPGPAPDAQQLDLARQEHAPGTELRSASAAAVNKRETEMFGNSDSFTFGQIDSGKSKENAATHAENHKTARVDSLKGKELFIPVDPLQPTSADTDHQPKRDAQNLKGVEGIVASASEYWRDAAKQGRAEGGISGNASALGADLMNQGVKAFAAANHLLDEVFPDGVVEPAKQFWNGVAKDGEAEGGLSGRAKEAAAKTMGGLLEYSGLGRVEEGSHKVVRDLDNMVPPEQLKSDAKWLLVDTVLAAATFWPGIAGAKGLARGETAYRTAAAGTEIGGMIGAGARAAESVGGKIAGAVTETLPASGEALTKESMANFVGKLKEIGSKYGIEIKEGGVVGESNGSINAIEYSSKAGGPHEVVHVVQQLQTRATALEARAAELGKNVADLSKSERVDVFNKVVKPFEDVAYNQHEMFAGQAHSWGRTSSQYREVILDNLNSFGKALSTGTVPEAAVGKMARAYGQLPNFLGRSQAEIGKNLAAPASTVLGQEFNSKWKELE